MPAKSHADRRAVLAAFPHRQTIPFQQILAALGPEWAAPARVACLRVLLRKMERDRQIIRIDRNAYLSFVSSSRFEKQTRDDVVSVIESIIHGLGGLASLEDIMEGLAPASLWGTGERDERRSFILAALTESGRFEISGEQVSVAA